MLIPGPSAPAGTLYRFSIVVMTPVRTDDGRFRRDGIVWDGVSSEGFSGSATVATHAIPRFGSVSDHAQVQPRQFIAQVYAATPLAGDHPRGSSPEFTVDWLYPPAWANDFADGVRAFDDKLYALLGVPLILFTSRHGRLNNYALVSFSSQRDRKGALRWDLSFQEIRKAYVAQVGVPTLPRAEKQAEPDTQECNTTEEEDGRATRVTIAAAKLGLDDRSARVYSEFGSEHPSGWTRWWTSDAESAELFHPVTLE